MEDFNSETDSDFTSYWRDWVSAVYFLDLVGFGGDKGYRALHVSYGARYRCPNS